MLISDSVYRHRFEPASIWLRCWCHCLLSLHFVLTDATHDVAFKTLFAAYVGVTITMLFPKYHFGSLVATLPLVPVLTALTTRPLEDGIFNHGVGYVLLTFALVVLHVMFYASDVANDDHGGATFAIDVIYACGVTGFVIYQHHPEWLATLAMNVITRGWYFGVVLLTIGIIVFVSRGFK